MSTLNQDFQMMLARFEEGVSADPTKNMSPEDAAKWKEMNETHRDNFKKAAHFRRVAQPSLLRTLGAEGVRLAKVNLKIPQGTRVVVNANPVSRALYSGGLPEDGTQGTVTPVSFGSSKRTFLPGPGGGMVYVKFDDGTFMGVSTLDLDKASGKKAMEHPSEDARKRYLQEHPKADPKNHTVKKDTGGGGSSRSKNKDPLLSVDHKDSRAVEEAFRADWKREIGSPGSAVMEKVSQDPIFKTNQKDMEKLEATLVKYGPKHEETKSRLQQYRYSLSQVKAMISRIKGKAAAQDPLQKLALMDLEISASLLPGVALEKDAAAMDEIAKLAAIERSANEMIGRTILDQMGGQRRLSVMLGVKKFILLRDGLAFAWPNKERTKGNYVEIRLDEGLDLYEMTFFNAAGTSKKLVKKYDQVYAEDLRDIFERQTGWYLRLASQQAHHLVQVASRNAGEGDEQTAKFEEGEPADPTENMSEEDAKKWRLENLKNKDKFKAAGCENLPNEKMQQQCENKKEAVSPNPTPARRSEEDEDPEDPDDPNGGGVTAEGCPDNLDSGECAEWEANTEKYQDKLKTGYEEGARIPDGWDNGHVEDDPEAVESTEGSDTPDGSGNMDRRAGRKPTSAQKAEAEKLFAKWREEATSPGDQEDLDEAWEGFLAGDLSLKEVKDNPPDYVKRAAEVMDEMYALVTSDGYMLGATDDWHDAKTKSYWRVTVDDSHIATARLFTLVNVPLPLAEKLSDVGTRAQRFNDGYDAWRAAKGFVEGSGARLASSEDEDKQAAGKIPGGTLRQATKLFLDLLQGMKAVDITSPFYAAFNVSLNRLTPGSIPGLLSQFDAVEKLHVLKMYLGDEAPELAAMVDPIIRLLKPYNKRAGVPMGLYGHTKRVQADCDTCVRKVQRAAARIAKKAYGKHEAVAEFLSVHAKRADSLPAKILVSALKEIGPKVASQVRLAELREDKTAAAPIPSPALPDKTAAALWSRMTMKPVKLASIAPQDVHFSKVLAAADALMKSGHALFDGVLIAKVTDGDAQTGEGVKQTTDKKAGSGSANAKYLAGLPSQMKDKILRAVAKHYGVSVSEIERELTDSDAEALYEYLAFDRGLAMQVLRDFRNMRLASGNKEAGRHYGLYGFGEKVAALGLQACTDLRHEAGRLAYDLHSRRGHEHHAAITDFFAQHGKQAKCMYSKLLHASYPDIKGRTASEAPATTVQGWLTRG